MRPVRAALIWLGVGLAIAIPLGAASFSPLLAWRDPVYILSGFAGIAALCLILLQPMLAAGYLPGLSTSRARRVHRWAGVGLIVLVVAHVGGLWITSPPDVLDALIFASPTLFTPFGVIAMWAVLAAGVLALWRKSLRLRVFRAAHAALVSVAAVGTVAHSVLIEGTMEPVSKAILCGLALIALFAALRDLRGWRRSGTARAARR